MFQSNDYRKDNHAKRSAMYYETVFIVNPDVSQENTEVLTNELIEKIEQAGSRIVKRE